MLLRGKVCPRCEDLLQEWWDRSQGREERQIMSLESAQRWPRRPSREGWADTSAKKVTGSLEEDRAGGQRAEPGEQCGGSYTLHDGNNTKQVITDVHLQRAFRTLSLHAPAESTESCEQVCSP